VGVANYTSPSLTHAEPSSAEATRQESNYSSLSHGTGRRPLFYSSKVLSTSLNSGQGNKQSTTGTPKHNTETFPRSRPPLVKGQGDIKKKNLYDNDSSKGTPV